jgi:Cu/Ag efflux protein CusF
MSAAFARAAKVSVVVVAAAAWGAIADERGADSAQTQETAATGVFHSVGVVTAVDYAKGWLTLDHEAIKGFMCAMEMMYRAEPPRLTADLRVGDRVAFDIDAGRYAIVGVKVLDNAAIGAANADLTPPVISKRRAREFLRQEFSSSED